MKKNIRKIFLLGLATGFVCLSAQEAEVEKIVVEEIEATKEVTMAQPGARCADDPGMGLVTPSERRNDDVGYDVYTQGDGTQCETSRKERDCRDSCRPTKEKSDCDSKNCRKGAAKRAQE